MTSAEIRQQYIDFFTRRHGHTFVPSSPVVPLDDPTLLFTNAGMNQFKPIFLGQEKRAYTRAANTQKCIRAGGKHNDLDDVGRSRRHHTFFEMLGNWSFGDYFKRGAIEMAWELLTQDFKLDPQRLHVSCYEGNPAAGIPRDEEAADLWRQIAGLPEDHIHYFGKDNFWEMGDTGPCGPCTEIYIDRTPEKNGGKEVNGNDPRVMEIWNLVFIQFNRDSVGKLTPLPAQHVDTGMGFERLCQVLQDKDDNYGTDLWAPLFQVISQMTGKRYTGLFPKTNAADPQAEAASAQLRHDIAFRVIADHARCLTFALTDGAVPSNEGRGYVLRRILRRAVRFGRQQLELSGPFLNQLVPVVVDSMGAAFPELKRDPARVIELIRDEEESFGRTLDRGIQLFDQAAVAGAISGADAFKLHDTYGFPIDLTRIMAEERGMAVDIAGYEGLMEQARQMARAGGKEGESHLITLSPEALSQLAGKGAAPTDDSFKYQTRSIDATVVGLWDGHQLVETLPGGAEAAVILDKSNFYAEMGGQVGDTGQLTSSGATFEVSSTRTVGGYVLHIGKLRSGLLAVGNRLKAIVSQQRELIERNHTATHLANWALREVLGDGVQQKGSLVDAEKLRFDFSHAKAMSDEELARVEQLVQQSISAGLKVHIQVAPQEQAMKIAGLRAVFGEKYPPMVRVVSIGAEVDRLLSSPADATWRNFSIEFCGGTHLPSTAPIAQLAITAEESVSKGIRRIVAVTSDTAQQVVDNTAHLDRLIDQGKAAADADLSPILANLQEVLSGAVSLRGKRRGQAAVADFQSRIKAHQKSHRASEGSGVDAVKVATDLLAKATSLGDARLIVGEIPGASDDQLRSAIDSLKKRAPSHAVLLASSAADKVTFVAAVSDDVIARGLKAGDWIKAVAAVAGGGGGGRPQMAQGSGKDATKIPDALQTAQVFASEKLH